jgi:hypothetical protein
MLLDTIEDHLKIGVIDRGERGEIAARLLLVDAYDRAIRAERSANPGQSSPMPYSQGCSLTTFLSELFSADAATLVMSAVSDVNSDPLEDTFRHAVVRFTHFVRAGDGYCLGSDVQCAAFTRCMAFIGQVGQVGVDLVIPVLLDRRKTLSEDNTTVILIQVKRRSQPSSFASTEMDAEALGVFKKGSTIRPYITFVMDLGVRMSGAGRSNSGIPSTPSKLLVKSPPTRQSPRTLVAKHPRFQFKVHGCSPSMYRGIKESHRAKWDMLLATRDMLDEHPRKDKWIKAVMHEASLVRTFILFLLLGITCQRHWLP